MANAKIIFRQTPMGRLNLQTIFGSEIALSFIVARFSHVRSTL